MSTITKTKYCPTCGQPTLHRVEPLRVSNPQSVPGGAAGLSVDLTGGFLKRDMDPKVGNAAEIITQKNGRIAASGQDAAVVPFTFNETCTRCGRSVTACGESMQNINSNVDDFTHLARGADWHDPGK